MRSKKSAKKGQIIITNSGKKFEVVSCIDLSYFNLGKGFQLYLKEID